jgi:pSer/pThr/pTyr-binding forkhead associated (FHA) protein
MAAVPELTKASLGPTPTRTPPEKAATARHPRKYKPMSTLTLLLIRLAFLAVLWLFVITAVGVVRTDLFGQSPSSRKQKRQRQNARPRPAKPARPARAGRGEPQRLLVTGGPLSGTTLPLTEQQITIGRSNDATLVLNDDYASSRHARLFPQDGQWIVEDLGSTNGTYLDRQKVTQPTPVPTGVPIRIGKTVLELRR